jgi:hypothetical protein
MVCRGCLKGHALEVPGFGLFGFSPLGPYRTGNPRRDDGRGRLHKDRYISRSLLKGVDNFIQNDFDRSIRAIVNADARHRKELALAVRIAEKIVIIDYLINRNPIA